MISKVLFRYDILHYLFKKEFYFLQVSSFSPTCLLKENQDFGGFSDVLWLVSAFKILLMEIYLSIVKKKKEKKKLIEHWYSKFFQNSIKNFKSSRYNLLSHSFVSHPCTDLTHLHQFTIHPALNTAGCLEP